MLPVRVPVHVEPVFWSAYDGDVLDLWQGSDGILDLGRVHIVAPGDNHVPLAVDDEQIAVLIDAAQITSGSPSVRVDHLVREFGVFPIACHHHVTANDDLAHLARVQFATVLIANA